MLAGDEETARAIRNDANRLAVKLNGDDIGILGGPDVENRRTAWLPDSPSIYVEWKHPVNDRKVQVVKAFDVRLAAVANTYGVGSILTFNAADFKRYRNLVVPESSSLLS
jgi:hypothetical protein